MTVGSRDSEIGLVRGAGASLVVATALVALVTFVPAVLIWSVIAVDWMNSGFSIAGVLAALVAALPLVAAWLLGSGDCCQRLRRSRSLPAGGRHCSRSGPLGGPLPLHHLTAVWEGRKSPSTPVVCVTSPEGNYKNDALGVSLPMRPLVVRACELELGHADRPARYAAPENPNDLGRSCLGTNSHERAEAIVAEPTGDKHPGRIDLSALAGCRFEIAVNVKRNRRRALRSCRGQGRHRQHHPRGCRALQLTLRRAEQGACQSRTPARLPGSRPNLWEPWTAPGRREA